MLLSFVITCWKLLDKLVTHHSRLNTYANKIAMYILELSLYKITISFSLSIKKHLSYSPTQTNEEGAWKTSPFPQPGINVHQIFMNWQECVVTFGGRTVQHKIIPEY